LVAQSTDDSALYIGQGLSQDNADETAAETDRDKEVAVDNKEGCNVELMGDSGCSSAPIKDSTFV